MSSILNILIFFCMKHFFIGLLGMMLASPMAAQGFIEGLERVEVGKGRIVIHQDPVITRLVNGSSNTAKEKRVDEAEPSSVLKKKDSDSSASIVKGDQSAPKAYRSKYTTVGYRIQVYAGGNSRTAREQAMRKGNLVKKYFSDVPVYTHFYSPRWTCRVGDFRSYEEASRALSELKSTGAFGEAVIVKCKIQVAY